MELADMQERRIELTTGKWVVYFGRNHVVVESLLLLLLLFVDDLTTARLVRCLHARRQRAEGTIARADTLSSFQPPIMVRKNMMEYAVRDRGDAMISASTFAEEARDILNSQKQKYLNNLVNPPTPAVAISKKVRKPSSSQVKCFHCRMKVTMRTSIILPTASSIVDYGHGNNYSKKGPRFCSYECARLWVFKHRPPQRRHEILTLIDVVSGRLVGLVEHPRQRPNSSHV